LAVRPGHPDHIYANTEFGATIAFSGDGDLNWERTNDMEESYFGYTNNIVFLPNNPDQIFQGSENPLDFAWLGRYNISPSEPDQLTDYVQILDIEDWGNSRPNELKTYGFAPNALYVGQESALSKVTGNDFKFIFKYNRDIADGKDVVPSYIYGIWVDPVNTDHLLFGGSVNGEQSELSLYETFDDGGQLHRFDDKFGMQFPAVQEIVPTDTYPAIIVADEGDAKIRLVLYKGGDVVTN